LIVPIDLIDIALAVAVDCGPIRVCQLRAGNVIRVMLQEQYSHKDAEGFGAS